VQFRLPCAFFHPVETGVAVGTTISGCHKDWDYSGVSSPKHDRHSFGTDHTRL
jgi:hypothetical protein